MVRVQQSSGWNDDSMTIRIRIIAKGDIELVLEVDQARHRPRARTIHPDFTVVIDRHETKSVIDLWVYDGDIETIAFSQRLPVSHRRAPKRIDADLHTGRPDRFQVDNVWQIH